MMIGWKDFQFPPSRPQFSSSMPALVKTLSKKKESSKGSVSGLGKTSASVTPAKRKKHALDSNDEDDAGAEEEMQKKVKTFRGKEKEKSLGKSQEKVKAADVGVKPKPKEKALVTARKAEAKEKDKGRKSDGKEKEAKKKATGKKGVTMGTLKKSPATESKTKRTKAPTPSPESSDAEADSGESDEEEDEDESAVESGVESSDDDKSEGKQKEAGASSDKDEEVSGEEEEDANQDEQMHLRGFSSNESDSSDEEDEDDALNKAQPVNVGKLPTVAKDDATVKRKLDKAKRQASEERGVIYLGRIPHGFYEDQMRAYFSQFGDVTRLRLSRNKKTGRSKHYAFIEFKSAAVAQIVAETMDNYLLMGHLLQCKLVPKEEVHPELWVGSNRRFRKVPMARLERLQQNKTRTDEQQKKIERRLLKRQEQKKRKLEALGIDYDMAPFSYSKKNKKDV
ncbi:NOP15 [Sanghuangporus weigelae]